MDSVKVRITGVPRFSLLFGSLIVTDLLALVPPLKVGIFAVLLRIALPDLFACGGTFPATRSY